MSLESSDMIARLARLEHLASQLEQILLVIQARLAAAEQGLGQVWFQ